MKTASKENERERKRNYNDGSLKVGVDSLKEQLADDSGNRWQDEAAADGSRERDRIRVGRVGDSGRARQVL